MNNFWDGFEKRASQDTLVKEALAGVMGAIGKGLGYGAGALRRGATAAAKGIGQGVGAARRGISEGISSLGSEMRSGYYQGMGKRPPAPATKSITKDMVRRVDTGATGGKVSRKFRMQGATPAVEASTPANVSSVTNQGIGAINKSIGKGPAAAAQPNIGAGAAAKTDKNTYTRNATAVMKKHPYATAAGVGTAGYVLGNMANGGDRRY